MKIKGALEEPRDEEFKEEFNGLLFFDDLSRGFVGVSFLSNNP